MTAKVSAIILILFFSVFNVYLAPITKNSSILKTPKVDNNEFYEIVGVNDLEKIELRVCGIDSYEDARHGCVKLNDYENWVDSIKPESNPGVTKKLDSLKETDSYDSDPHESDYGEIIAIGELSDLEFEDIQGPKTTTIKETKDELYKSDYGEIIDLYDERALENEDKIEPEIITESKNSTELEKKTIASGSKNTRESYESDIGDIINLYEESAPVHEDEIEPEIIPESKTMTELNQKTLESGSVFVSINTKTTAEPVNIQNSGNKPKSEQETTELEIILDTKTTEEPENILESGNTVKSEQKTTQSERILNIKTTVKPDNIMSKSGKTTEPEQKNTESECILNIKTTVEPDNMPQSGNTAELIPVLKQETTELESISDIKTTVELDNIPESVNTKETEHKMDSQNTPQRTTLTTSGNELMEKERSTSNSTKSTPIVWADELPDERLLLISPTEFVSN